MNILTSINLLAQRLNTNYDKLGNDLNIYIKQQRNLGLSAKSIQTQLLKDLKNESGVFREIFSGIKNEQRSDYNKTGEILSNEMVKDTDLLYSWVIDPDVKEHCGDCIKRSNMRNKKYEYWEKIGLPATGTTECGAYCKCTLMPNV